MSYTSILFTLQDGVARLTLNRPDRLNSFNDVMHEEIRTVLGLIEQSHSKPSEKARVLLITGAGRGFCAGQDLNDRSVSAAGENAKPVDLGASVEKNYKPLITRLQNLPIPIICAVNGVAAGAGASLALAADITVAAESASFLQAFSKIGLIPDTGSTWFLTHRVGMARAMGLALLAEKLPASKAAQWGLIWDCVPDEQLMPTVEAMAKQFASGPSKAYVRTRQAMRAAMSNDLAQQLDVERDTMRELGQSYDYREGVAAFLAKRTPQFTGA